MQEPEFPHLQKAPIAEAVIEIRAEVPVPVAEENFASLQKQLSDAYPHASALRVVSTRIDFERDSSKITEGPGSKIGLRLESADRKIVILAKNDGLAVSRLQPYETWEALVAVVRSTWPIYVESFAPTTVVRLGVRYINRLVFADGVDLDTVFTAGPRVPPALPQVLAQYHAQVLMPFETHQAMLAITHAADPTAPAGQSGALLDIDAFCQVQLPPDAAEIWERFEKLHDVKNKAFFGALQRSVWESYL